MKLLDCIKQLFSSGEYEEETIPTYKDDSEDQETYYVPPFEEPNFEKPSINNSETYVDDPSSISMNNIDSTQDKEDNVINTNDSSSKPDNNSENKIPHNEGTERVVQLQKDVISSIEEFDTYLSRIDNEDAKELITLFQHRLIESLVASGATPIDKDIEFDCLRHVPVPFSIVQDGMPIKEILRMGLEYNGRVVLKAKVGL